MLDVKTLKVLEFLNEHPGKWFSIDEMRNDGVPADSNTLQWMEKHEMVLKGESDDPEARELDRMLRDVTYFYSIGAGGRVALTGHKHSVRTERRANLAIVISVVSLFVSIFTMWQGR